MITKINNNSFFRTNINNSKPNQRVNTLQADTVSFKANTLKFIDKPILEMIQKLQTEQPVIGYKKNGCWVLPNLLHPVGQKFNLFTPSGDQLSFTRGITNCNRSAFFSLKKHSSLETSNSKIHIPNSNEEKLKKTKVDRLISFRITTRDFSVCNENYKSGQIEKVIRNEDSIIEIADLTDEEYNLINNTLKKFLPYFF